MLSPPAAELPTLAEQDTIRNAFIYNPATVEPVGKSRVLTGIAAFGNAREPLAQAFKKVGDTNANAFGVIVNHFKSKGSGVDDGTGQGLANADRVAQARALADFADQFQASRDLGTVFLTGDFNSYSQEDPMQVLDDAGWTNLESDQSPEYSYSFSGRSGSLDHVLVNDGAASSVTGVDIWDINAGESVAYQYSRRNYNITQFFNADDVFAASDHNPEIVGFDLPVEPETQTIQILGTNDFHGRIANDPASSAAGAAVMAGAIDELRAQNPNTVFAAAGDLIGASTFESFIANDKPTIDALNAAGLEVSSVGNHEFDQGYDDLVNRVMAPYDETTNPDGGAAWQYLAANVDEPGDADLIPDTWTTQFGDVEVGFVGAVTEHLPELVSPGGMQGVTVTDIVDSTNAAADQLKADGADIVVMLVHEGAPGTDCDDDGRRPDVRLRRHHLRGQRQRRRHHLRPHPPRLQLQVPGRGLGGPAGDRAARGLCRPVRRGAEPAEFPGRRDGCRDRHLPADPEPQAGPDPAVRRGRRRRRDRRLRCGRGRRAGLGADR